MGGGITDEVVNWERQMGGRKEGWCMQQAIMEVKGKEAWRTVLQCFHICSEKEEQRQNGVRELT